MKHAIAFALGIFLSLSSHASAAEKCYEQVTVPAHWVCSNTDSKSADFSEGCYMEPQTVKNVEVACPPKEAEWVNGSPLLSQTQVCSALDMKVSKIDGTICKSREIKDGGTVVEGRSGSSKFQSSPGACRDSPCDTISYRVLGYETSNTVYLCWNASGRRDYDPTDGVSHYACIDKD
jgi:hypothetical protein